MEREGEREMRRRGRGIIVGGIVLLLVLGCNNGAIEKLEKKNQFLGSVVSLGNEFLNVFTSFGDMVGGVLGFSDKTPKSKIGEYFKQVKDTVEGAKSKLNTMVERMKAENNPNASKTEAAVTELNAKLAKIIEGAETASGAIGAASEPIGNVASGQTKGVGGDIENLVKGIKAIVDVALGEKEGDAVAGDAKMADDSSSSRNGSNGASKLFDGNAGISGSEKQSANDAIKAVGAVTGADILQAIAKGADGGASKLAKHNAAISGVGVSAPKDAEIAGGIALRAMAKNGKFANASSSIDVEVKRAVTSAVTKALDTLTIAIRKTIDEGLKEVKKAMNINANDTPVTSETASSAK